MPCNFQVICGSMVVENRRSPASTKTPVLLEIGTICYTFIKRLYSYK